MIIDSSVLIAILRGEEEAEIFVSTIAFSVDAKRLSAANYLETAIIIDANKDPVLSRRFDDFLDKATIAIEPITKTQAIIAREAYRDFGKGTGQAAKLNFGDCFAYALAKEKNEPLFFKGNDFVHTDIEPQALAS